MEKISTPAAKLSQLQILGKPAIDPQDYPKCPAQPLVVYKLALQMVFEAGFDSTSKLQRSSKEEQEKPKTQATDFQKKLQQIASTLTQKCSLDLKLAEELVNPIDPDSMDDANYVKMHVLMESLEQLNDHNDVTVEYPLYDNVKKYGLDVSLEDQPVTTFSPVQVYLAPFDQRVLCPYLNARFSSVDYCFPDLPRKLQSCVFINDYNKVKDPNNTQKLYLSSVIQTTGEALPQDFIHRQLSAHEMWVNLISQRQNFPLQCSIADSYCAVIENTSHELNQMLNQLQDVEQDTMLQKLQIYQKQPLKQSNTNYDKFIEQIIANVINQSPIKSEPLNPPTGRNYQFKSDFDVSLRGMMEQKSTVHHFYQFETNKKIAFLQPILAQKILQYTKMGEFSKFINQELVIPHDQVENTLVFEDSSDSMKESVKAPETKVQSELMVTVGKLTQEFCDIILKQHQELLKVILQSQQSVTYVESQFQTQDQNDFDDLLIRPVCGCYTCNLCSLSETFEFTEKIFPLLKLRKPRHLVLDENEAPSDFYVSQKEFVEKVLGLDYTHDFTKMVPYFPTFCKKLKQDLNLDLGQLSVQPDPSSNRKSKKKTPKQKKLSPDFLFQQILFFCACAPQFLQYPASYGAYYQILIKYQILNCNFLYKFQEFNFRLKYQYITCIKHLEETEYDEQTDLNGNDNSNGNDELEQLFDMVVDTQQYNYGNNIPFARNLSDEKEMLLKDSSQVDQTIKQDQFLQKQKLKQKFELIFSIKNYLKKIYENKPAQIATIVITVVAAVGFGMGLINTEHGINISYLLDSSKQKDNSTIQFQQQFNGARMSPYTININCSESVVTKVQQEALYLAVLNIIHEFSKQFSEQPQLQISEKDFQCPFLINSEFISISRKAELEQIYKDFIGGKDLSDYSVFDINQSVAYNYVYNTQTSSNNQNFFCYVYPNISINGELTKQFVPYMRGQMSQFQKVMQNYNQTFGVSAVILGYGAHINDIGQRVHSFLATYILCVCAIAFGITGGLVFSIANITSQIIYFSLVFLFSTVIINVIYHIFQKQMLNPFLHIFNTAVSMSMVSSSMSVLLLKLRTQYLKKRDLKTALLSIADDCLSQLQTNLLIILTTWILILSNVEILRQIGIILFSNGIIMTVFVVPFGFIGFYCLLGQVGLWPYKKYIALGE
ncbi:Conserved_hypothetical protein [Hexamita inflata]|uniref:Transmembrane protein n=1 Tax=Hexamita inflata TaxID=28002 RepID=A0AA86PTA4_9EUKA|nr:Conserved hypothetical protein [Hexamita inflata]